MGRSALTGGRAFRAAALAASLLGAAGAPSPAAAQAHPGGRWVTIETPHFQVHYRPGSEELTLRVAAEAEAAYAALAVHVPAPRGPVDLVVADHADFANAFAIPWPSPRVVVYPVPPVAEVELQRYDRWLAMMLRHELAHVFQLDLARGWWRAARAVFGRAPVFFPGAFAPTWMIEGIAVHYESALGVGRDQGSYHRAVEAAQAAEGGGMPIDAANAASPRWPGGYRPYVYGGLFLDHLTSGLGDSVVDRLVSALARAPVPYAMLNGALGRAAGLPLTRAWRTWQKLGTIGDGDGAGRAVPSGAPAVAGVGGLRGVTGPRVSADGRSVIFLLRDGVDDPRVAVLDRATGEVERREFVDGVLSLAWEPDGGALVSRLEHSDPYTVRGDLWRVPASGRPRRLTRGARLVAADVGPDGAVLAVRLDRGTNSLVRWADGRFGVVAPPEPGTAWAHPRVSPDGSLLAVTREVGGNLDVVLLSREGALVRSVTRDAAIDQMPAFSHDGRWLFWTSDRTGSSQVYATRVATDDGRWWRVTGEPFGAYAPAPAVDSVFFLAYHSDGYRLAAAPLDTLLWAPVEPPAPAELGTAGGATASGPSPAVVVSSHPYRPWRSLRPRWWLPFGEGQGEAAWLGVITGANDALGRHAYLVVAAAGTGTAAGTWRADASYSYAGLSPFVLDASYSRGEQAYVTSDALGNAVGRCCVRSEEAVVGAVLLRPRLGSSAYLRVEGTWERDGPVERVGGALGAGYARLDRPGFAVSAQRGWQAAGVVRVRRRADAAAGSSEAVLQAAVYLPLGVTGFARRVFAVRASAGMLGGRDPLVFSVGGPSGGGVQPVPGIEVGAGRRTFPVRGFEPRDAWGRAAASVSAEYRVPLVLVGRGSGLMPGSLERLSAAVFADVAAAWSPARGLWDRSALAESRELGSAGAELAADLGVFYDVPVRARVGAAWRLGPRTGPAVFVVLGTGF